MQRKLLGRFLARFLRFQFSELKAKASGDGTDALLKELNKTRGSFHDYKVDCKENHVPKTELEKLDALMKEARKNMREAARKSKEDVSRFDECGCRKCDRCVEAYGEAMRLVRLLDKENRMQRREQIPR